MNLNDIKPIHIQTYINQMARRYAPETVRKDLNVLRLIFSTVVDNQLCTKSPVTGSIKLPKYESRVKKTALTQSQYTTAYNFAKTWPQGLAIMLMMEAGISRSELLGLRWEDIDREQYYPHQAGVGHLSLRRSGEAGNRQRRIEKQVPAAHHSHYRNVPVATAV